MLGKDAFFLCKFEAALYQDKNWYEQPPLGCEGMWENVLSIYILGAKNEKFSNILYILMKQSNLK